MLVVKSVNPCKPTFIMKWATVLGTKKSFLIPSPREGRVGQVYWQVGVSTRDDHPVS